LEQCEDDVTLELPHVNLLTGIRTQAFTSVMIAVLSGMPEKIMIEFIYSHPDVIARVESNFTQINLYCVRKNALTATARNNGKKQQKEYDRNKNCHIRLNFGPNEPPV
jgi:hypothetical protein